MLVAQPQWTPGPRQIEFRPTGQTKFVICDYTIEFIIRDAKQHLGLSQCQARDQAKLDFHLNASVAGVNLGRLASRLLRYRRDTSCLDRKAAACLMPT